MKDINQHDEFILETIFPDAAYLSEGVSMADWQALYNYHMSLGECYIKVTCGVPYIIDMHPSKIVSCTFTETYMSVTFRVDVEEVASFTVSAGQILAISDRSIFSE